VKGGHEARKKNGDPSKKQSGLSQWTRPAKSWGGVVRHEAKKKSSGWGPLKKSGKIKTLKRRKPEACQANEGEWDLGRTKRRGRTGEKVNKKEEQNVRVDVPLSWKRSALGKRNRKTSWKKNPNAGGTRTLARGQSPPAINKKTGP